MGMTAILTADDLHEINRELARGNDVEIRRTAEGLAIKAHTVRSGRPNVAPMAAGRQKPMVPIPPEVTVLRGFVNLK